MTGATLGTWLDAEPDLLARAARGDADLDDCVQDAAERAVRTGRTFASPVECAAWLRLSARRRRAQLERRAAKAGLVVTPPAEDPAPPPDVVVDATDAVRRASRDVPRERLLPLVECLSGSSTLESAGEDLGMTREGVRQARDKLASRLRLWAEGRRRW